MQNRLDELVAAARAPSEPVQMTEPLSVGQFGQAFALLLRGEAFRGSPNLATYKEPHANEAERHRSQLDCSESLQREVISPLVDAGFRVDVFVAAYTDVNASSLRALTGPYSSSVVRVVRLFRERSRQNIATRAILDELLTYAARTATSYDAIILTRFDLYWKPLALRGDGTDADADAQASAAESDAPSEASSSEALSPEDDKRQARNARIALALARLSAPIQARRSIGRLLNARRSFVFLFRERHGHWRDAHPVGAPPVHGSERTRPLDSNPEELPHRLHPANQS